MGVLTRAGACIVRNMSPNGLVRHYAHNLRSDNCMQETPLILIMRTSYVPVQQAFSPGYCTGPIIRAKWFMSISCTRWNSSMLANMVSYYLRCFDQPWLASRPILCMPDSQALRGISLRSCLSSKELCERLFFSVGVSFAMIRQLKTLTFFFTVSAGGPQWPELLKAPRAVKSIPRSSQVRKACA